MKLYTQPGADESATETTTTKRLEGFPARFGTEPDEIYLELRLGSPAHIHLREGDYLQEGDTFHREQLSLSSPTLATREVIEITPELVHGRELETGEEVAWDREEIERGLAHGTYSTNLTDFEWISVYQVGRWRDVDTDADESDLRYRGRPYVSVVANGDNGLKYGRRYRFVEPDATEIYLWKQDEPAGGFSDEAEDRLDERVTGALEAEGFQVVDAPASR